MLKVGDNESGMKDCFKTICCVLLQTTADTLQCLRDIPAANISSQQWNSYSPIMKFPSTPTIDGTFLPKHPIDMLKEGNFKKAELLIGSNLNEGKELHQYGRFLYNFNVHAYIQLVLFAYILFEFLVLFAFPFYTQFIYLTWHHIASFPVNWSFEIIVSIVLSYLHRIAVLYMPLARKHERPHVKRLNKEK